MDLIQSYGDSDDEENDKDMERKEVVSNPSVADPTGPSHVNFSGQPLKYNPTFDETRQFGMNSQEQNSDKVEKYFMDDFTFDQEYYKSQRTRRRKIKKQVNEDSVEFDIMDPNVKNEMMEKYQGFPVEALVIEEIDEDGNKSEIKPKKDEPDEDVKEPPQKKRKLMDSKKHAVIRPGELLHPRDIRPASKQKTRLPKRLAIHFKKAHTKGINRILFFPGLGHLLLSGSVDSTIKLWDVHQRKKLVQTYFGYGQTVHDLAFTQNGYNFISTHGNGVIKVWDTEVGKVISEHNLSDELENTVSSVLGEVRKNRKMVSSCVKVNPRNENDFIAGYRTNQIVQWDRRVNKHVKVYDKHQKSVTDLLYIKQGSRFVSSSHDGSLRVWEYGNNEDSVRYISENYVKVALRLCAHPIHSYFLVQSITSNIFLFQIRDRDDYRLQGRRKLSGHKLSRYPCRIGASPDGKWVFSGDSEGTVFFWRWNDDRVKEKRRNVHSNVVMDCCWSPNHRSHFATCGWDGDIKMIK